MSRERGPDDDHPRETIGEGGDAVSSLLDAVGARARSDDAEAATFPADQVPALTDELREGIVQRVSAAGASDTGGAKVTSLADARSRLRRARPAIVAAAGALAVAAAVLLWMRPKSEGGALPPFSISAEGGEKDVRGAPAPGGGTPTLATLQRVRARSELTVSVRPETPVKGAVAARAFVVSGDAIAEAPAISEVAPSGAVRLVLKGADLVGARRGPGLLRVVLGRPDVVAGFDPQRSLRDSSGPGWLALTVPLVFEAD